MSWGHNELARDLANHFRGAGRMVWEDMQLGPSGSPRPDVFTMAKSFVRPQPTTYEVKVSVSDFRSDITSGKWQSYSDFSAAIYFAVPRGLVNKGDVPNGCGLIVRGDGGWRAVKKATVQKITLPESALLKLLMDGIDRLQDNIGPRELNVWAAAAKIRKKYGDDVAAVVQNLHIAREHLSYMQDEYRRLNEKIDAEVRSASENARRKVEMEERHAAQNLCDLREALGAQPDTSPIDLTKMVRRLIEEAAADDRLNIALAKVKRAQAEMYRAQTALEGFQGGPE